MQFGGQRSVGSTTHHWQDEGRMESTAPVQRFMKHGKEVAAALVTVGRSMTGGPRSIGGVCVLIDHTGRLLLVQARYRKGWNLPGGFLSATEDPAQGIRRELTEEVAYPTSAPTPPVILTFPRRNHDEYVSALQLDRAVAIQLHVVTWELSEMRWCLPSEMPPLHAITTGILHTEFALVTNDDGRWVLADKTVGNV
jgi:ADP-ribose pyrophosphatase YjhB (NUDIX family)